MDALSVDFAHVTQSLVSQQDKVRGLEEEVSVQMQLLDKAKDQSQKSKLTAAQDALAQARSEVSRLVMDKDRIVALLAQIDVKSEVKEEPEQITKQTKQKGKKSK